MSSIKQGYKQTKVGIIPEDWEVKKLGNLTNIATGKTPLRSNTQFWENGTIHWATTTEVNETYIVSTNEKITNQAIEELKLKILPVNTILLAMYGQGKTRGKVALLKIESTINQAFAAIKPNKNYSTNFVFNFLDSMYEKIRDLSHGSNQDNLNLDIVKALHIPIPPLKEQEKIAEILTTWDEAISLHVKLIEEKEQLKIGLMQKLLSGEVRFAGFCDKWEEVRLGEIIKEINHKTTESNQYEVLSVTKQGIYSQQDHFNKQIASEDNSGYKIVKYGNLVFSTMNLWMGSLDIVKNYEIGIVSPAYKVFEINFEYFNIDFIQSFFRSHHMIWLYNMNSEQGASIVRKNLDLNSLLTTKVKIPSFMEQCKIGEVLSLAGDELNLLKKELEELKQQKKGLMQKLLTGEVRVKI